MTDPPSERIGRYLLEATAGGGAFATVYRARDERLDATVAIKVLAENHSLDPDMRERFLTEGRVLRRVDSPHVVAVHDLGETGRQQPYLVLDYADRGVLSARVAELRRLGWKAGPDDVRAIADPLAQALHAVHGAQVVHRDLSPGNVLLSTTTAASRPSDSALVRPDERPLLADLGLCKDLAVNSGYTAAGGTEGFRAPEQRRSPAVVTPATDLWSLSAVVVWLITGASPGPEPVRDAVTGAGLPSELGAVLDTALAADPADRCTDAEQWRAAVAESLRPAARLTSSPPGGTAPSGPPHPERRAASRLGRAAAAVAVAALASALTLAVVFDGGLLSSDQVEVTDLGGGEVRVADRTDSVAFTGPAEVGVGQAAAFTADVDGSGPWTWVSPEGQLHPGAPALEVTASSPGTATVTLIGTTSEGAVIEVAHQVRVAE